MSQPLAAPNNTNTHASTSSPTITATPTLFFTNDLALPAAQFYTTLFPSSTITRITHWPPNPSTPDSMSPATPMAITLTLLSTTPTPLHLLFLNLPASESTSDKFPFKFNESFSITVDVETQEEVDHYWDALIKDGGEGRECCWCRDRFGVFWQIVPRGLIRALEGGGERAGRAQGVMLGWGKADLKKLEEAIGGDGEGA